MLTVPLALAALSAGAVGGVHCVGMCGGIATLLSQAGGGLAPNRFGKFIPLQNISAPQPSSTRRAAAAGWRYQLQLQSGRIFTYMLIGAVFGTLGAAGFLFRPYLPVQHILFVAGNLALIMLGLRLLGVAPRLVGLKALADRLLQLAYAVMPGIRQGSRYPFLIGMSWGCLPCGLLYGVAPFALLSGDGVSGALLMLLFGLSALPHLLLVQGLSRSRQLQNGKLTRVLKLAAAAILIALGLLGLWYFDMKNMPGFLCVLPNS